MQKVITTTVQDLIQSNEIIFNVNNNIIKLRNSTTVEDRRKSTRHSDADVARHGMFLKNSLESYSRNSAILVESEVENNNRIKKSLVTENGLPSQNSVYKHNEISIQV